MLSEQNVDALLDRIADTLADLMPYDALHVYEADEEHGELIPVLARSQWYEEEIMGSRPKFGEGLTGWAVESRTPVWTNRAHLDPRVVNVSRHPGRARGPDHDPADRTRPAQRRAQHLPGRRGRSVLRARVRAGQVVRRCSGPGDGQRPRPDASRASGADRFADRALQPPLLPRAAACRADACLAVPRLDRRADARSRRLQARQRHSRPQRRATSSSCKWRG